MRAATAKKKKDASTKKKDQDRILGTGKGGKRDKISFKLAI